MVEIIFNSELADKQKYIIWIKSLEDKLEKRKIKYVVVDTIGNTYLDGGSNVPMFNGIDTMHIIKLYKRKPKEMR